MTHNAHSPIRDRKIFISGGAGFIGSRLAERLVEQNEVVIFDTLSRNSLQHSPLAAHPNFKVIKGDVLDLAAVKDAMQGTDLVVHCAAVAGIDTVVVDPIRTIRVNVTGTDNVLTAATELPDCKRFVCFSTSEIFGPRAFRSTEEDESITGVAGEARWTYAASKLTAEHLALSFRKRFDLPVVILRPFNVYGPGQIGDGALKTFVMLATSGAPIEVHGDGVQIRAWCYIDDMVDATLAAMTHPKAIGETFNIGNPKAITTIYGLANTVIRIVGSSSEILFVPPLSADVDFRIPSTKKATETLGFTATTDLEDGIRKTASFFLEQGSIDPHGH